MQPRHGIRANLPANRESRQSYKRRVKQDAFGVYRPLTEESADQVWDVLGEAKNDIKSFFGHYRNSPAELVVPVEMGVTFVPKGKVRKALGKGLLERLDGARMLERIESHNEHQEVSLPVPLHDTDWYSDQERKLVFCFAAQSPAVDELTREADIVSHMLGDSKAHELQVIVPNHFTLMKYGRARDGQDLSTDHKQMVGSIVEEHFRVAGLHEIALGRMVIGGSYTQMRQAA